MRDLGRFEPQGTHLGEKLRHTHPRATKFDDANTVEQIGGEKWPHPGLHLVGERSSHGEIMLTLFPQVTSQPFNGLSNLLGAGLGNWRSRSGVGNLVFNGGVKVVERGSRL